MYVGISSLESSVGVVEGRSTPHQPAGLENVQAPSKPADPLKLSASNNLQPLKTIAKRPLPADEGEARRAKKQKSEDDAKA